MRRTKLEAMATREAILDAAELVFHERGVGQTSLAQIASAACVTRGAIYWHFCNKADLFKAMQDRVRLPQEDFFRSRELARSERCLEALYDTSIETLRSFSQDERAKRVYTIILWRCEYVGEMREALLRSREGDDRMKQTIVEVFERASSLQQLCPRWMPTIAANAYFCTMVGLISEWLRLEASFDILQTATPMMDSLFASYRASATRPALCMVPMQDGVPSCGSLPLPGTRPG